MSANNDVGEDLREQRREYQWNAAYDRRDEYDKNPEWTDDMRSEVCEDGSDDYERPQTMFYDRFDPEHMWIKSDKTYELTRMR